MNQNDLSPIEQFVKQEILPMPRESFDRSILLTIEAIDTLRLSKPSLAIHRRTAFTMGAMALTGIVSFMAGMRFDSATTSHSRNARMEVEAPPLDPQVQESLSKLLFCHSSGETIWGTIEQVKQMEMSSRSDHSFQ